MTRLLILDKDGTLVQPVSGAKFVTQPYDQELLPGVAEAVDCYAAAGWVLCIASNQAGIAAEYKTLEGAIAEMAYCLHLLPQIEEAYFCPDFEGQHCWRVWGSGAEAHRICYTAEHSDVAELGLSGQFRKPGFGMLVLASRIQGADELLYVGDRPEDEQAATGAGSPFQWAHEWRKYGF